MFNKALMQREALMDYVYNLWGSDKISKVHMQDIYKDEYEHFVTEPMPYGGADRLYDEGLEELEFIGG